MSFTFDEVSHTPLASHMYMRCLTSADIHSIFIDFPQAGDHHALDGMMIQVVCGQLDFLVVLVIPNLCKYCMYLEPPMTSIFEGQPPQKQALFQPKLARSIVQQRVGCT